MSGEISERLLGKSQGCRLFLDQERWLEEMKAQRAAAPHGLIRAAIDHYRPVYEALNQSADPELQALANEAATTLGVDLVRDMLRGAMERSRALQATMLTPEPVGAATETGGAA